MSGEAKVADASARRRVAVLAGHSGDVATARRLLDDPDPIVRVAALGALHRCVALTPAELSAAIQDPDPAVRHRTAEVIAALTGRGPAADISLLPLLDDPDPTVVEVAAWASGEREPPEPDAVTRLIELVGTADDTLVREAAVAALGAIGDPTGLPAILAATRDKATVRRRAVIALAPFDGPEVDEAYERALGDRDWQVRQVAEDLTGRPSRDPKATGGDQASQDPPPPT